MRTTFVADIYHLIASMLSAVQGLLAPGGVEAWVFRAGIERATSAAYINHADACMFLAVHCLFCADITKNRALRTGVMRANPVADVHHVGVSMFLAVPPYPAALGVEEWLCHAGSV